nr:MAG TPA: hypothetical protein [Caudoviricetes sp.]
MHNCFQFKQPPLLVYINFITLWCLVPYKINFFYVLNIL